MRKFAALYLFVFAMLLFQSCKTAKGIDRKQTEMKMLEALEWQEAHPIQVKAPTDWTNGAYYTGVAKAHQSTKNKEFLDALISMGQRNNWQPWERYFHADDLAITYPYLYLESIGVKAVDLEPTQKIIQEHLYKPHAWKEGEKEMEEILWWWCDALFMAPPALTLYADLQDNRQYLDEMHKYYMETYNLLYDKEEHLFARDNRFLWKGEDSDKKDENGRKIFWSRGNGWVLGGLALLLEKMPEDYEHRSFYEGLYKEMAAKIKEIQPEEGLWTTSLLSPESYDHGEVSGSGFFTFAMAWGINNDLLDADEYKPTVLRAWKGLQAAQQESGKVGWVQNIGFDPRPADVDSWQNYGTGAFLLAGSEMLKLK